MKLSEMSDEMKLDVMFDRSVPYELRYLLATGDGIPWWAQRQLPAPALEYYVFFDPRIEGKENVTDEQEKEVQQ
jgi:hypothetical protein